MFVQACMSFGRSPMRQQTKISRAVSFVQVLKGVDTLRTDHTVFNAKYKNDFLGNHL